MTLSTLAGRFLLASAAALLCLGAQPGHAEENRLLPFWGQPFPSGFTRKLAADPTIGRGPRCRYVAGFRRSVHPRGQFDGRCVVLHARG